MWVRSSSNASMHKAPGCCEVAFSAEAYIVRTRLVQLSSNNKASTIMDTQHIVYIHTYTVYNVSEKIFR